MNDFKHSTLNRYYRDKLEIMPMLGMHFLDAEERALRAICNAKDPIQDVPRKLTAREIRQLKVALDFTLQLECRNDDDGDSRIECQAAALVRCLELIYRAGVLAGWPWAGIEEAMNKAKSPTDAFAAVNKAIAAFSNHTGLSIEKL